MTRRATNLSIVSLVKTRSQARTVILACFSPRFRLEIGIRLQTVGIGLKRLFFHHAKFIWAKLENWMTDQALRS